MMNICGRPWGGTPALQFERQNFKVPGKQLVLAIAAGPRGICSPIAPCTPVLMIVIQQLESEKNSRH